MKKICAWCKKDLGEAGSVEISNPVTHGICPDCAREVLSFQAESMAEFLDKFLGPVYMLNSRCEMISANREGAEALGKELAGFAGELAGDAFECEFSKMEGGCGETVHCRTCTIRNSITYTYETGKSTLKIPAYPDLRKVTGETELQYLVSTEKIGEAVVLKIEEVKELVSEGRL